MGIKKVSSVLALSASILLLGGMNAKAETTYESIKANVAEKKGKVQSGKVPGIGKLDNLLKSQTTHKLLEVPKTNNGYSAQELTGNYLWEVEPNNDFSEADFLPQGDMMLGTFTFEDIDTFEIYVPHDSYVAIAGVMPTESLSDIGFILGDENDHYVTPDYVEERDHNFAAGYYLEEGSYYIYSINIGDYVTDDVYGVAWDIFEEAVDVTPPDAPMVDRFDDRDTELAGKTEPFATVEVWLEDILLSSGAANDKGLYRVILPETYPIGTILSVTATDRAGNTSDASYVTVADSNFTGWLTESGKRYHYTKGERDKGWFTENAKDYFLDPSTGEIKTGWISFNNKWYFFDRTTGVKKTGWLSTGGKWYYLDAAGVMQTGWEKVGYNWYYLHKSGVMAAGWVKDGGSWYYLAKSGAMKTGWIQDSGKWYYLASSGAMKTGWVKDGGSWYYLASSGVMKTGWVQVGSKWYYLYNSGKMAYSTKIGKYRLGADGAWIR